MSSNKSAILFAVFLFFTILAGHATAQYNGPRNLDSVLSYTWEQKRGGPSG